MKNNLLNTIVYYNKKATELSEDEIKACSDLFSSSYGMYEPNSPFNPGKQIKMGVKQYQKRYCKEGVYIVKAMDGDSLVGHAWYIRKKYEPYGTITWVLQLVVNRSYRRQGIASTLLRSIWGFSDDYAWGLASANPCTVKTLESATFRRCHVSYIKKNLDAIRLIGKDTTFVSENAYVVGKGISQVNSNFYADNSDYSLSPECEKYLGKLMPGHEWLAFTFREQPINKTSFRKHFSRMITGYESILKDAYGRMDVVNHTWAQGTGNEVAFIEEYIGKKSSVLDLGCGIGRHDEFLSKNGHKVVGIDNSHELIEYAKKNSSNKVLYIESDIRYYVDSNKYDAVLCLYDVIGSYPSRIDNKNIVRTAYKHLKKGGLLILSVMNMELTEMLIPDKNKGSIKNNPDILTYLAPSSVMQQSGNIFDGELLALDTDDKVVYRKEQFNNDNSLPAEYIIRDIRYTKEEICELVESVGFDVIEARYVQAGHWDRQLESTDIKAKEICVVCKK